MSESSTDPRPGSIIRPEPNVYYGILNPTGEANGSDTTYFEQAQLEQFAPQMTGLNLYINHQTEGKDGQPIEPAGKVLSAGLDQKGRLWCAVMPNPDQRNGRLADHFLNHDSDKFRMGSFSMGYDVKYDEEGKVVANRPTEVSICFEGAREGTHIKGKVPFDRFIKEGLPTKAENSSDQKYIKDTQEDQQKKETEPITDDKLEQDFEQLFDKMRATGQQQQAPKEEDWSNMIGRGGSLSMPAPTNVPAQHKEQIPEPSSRMEGPPEPAYVVPPVVKATASAAPEQPVEQPAAAPDNTEVDALLKEAFPEGLPEEAPATETTAMVEPIQLPDNISTSDKEMLTKLLEQNKMLAERLERATATGKERAEADAAEMRENQEKILPFIRKLQEVRGEIQNLKRHFPKMQEFSEHLVAEPNAGTLAVSNYLSAAASFAAEQESSLKRSADQLEKQYQNDRKKNKLIKLQKDENDRLKSELERFKNTSTPMFQEPAERLQAVTASKQLEPVVSDSKFLGAVKLGYERNYTDIPETHAVARANWLSEMFKTYGSEDTNCPVISRNEFKLA